MKTKRENLPISLTHDLCIVTKIFQKGLKLTCIIIFYRKKKLKYFFNLNDPERHSSNLFCFDENYKILLTIIYPTNEIIYFQNNEIWSKDLIDMSAYEILNKKDLDTF